MDEQPAKVVMRDPDGQFVTVLERERAAHEEKGFEYVSGLGAPEKAAAPLVRQSRGSRKKP